MIDLHAHLLPDGDDGAVDLAQSLEMLGLAREDGIAGIVATPHIFGPRTRLAGLDDLRKRMDAFIRHIGGAGLQIEIFRGAEVYFDPDIRQKLGDHRPLLTINGSDYFLLEFPPDFIFPHTRDFLFEVMADGFIPVLCHPERNLVFQHSLVPLREYVRGGALCQLDAGSLRGDFGAGAQRTAWEMIGANLVHVIASDAHDTVLRPPRLSYLRDLLSGVNQPQRIDLWLDRIPAAIVANEAVPDVGEPFDTRSGMNWRGKLRRWLS
jgi:protein-tyrosine phosphatase